MAEKKAKGAPKLNRISKHKAKYAFQYKRTFRNKVGRVCQHNGDAAARAYELRGPGAKGLELPPITFKREAA